MKIKPFLILITPLALIMSCATPQPASQDVIEKLRGMNLIGEWMYSGSTRDSSNSVLIISADGKASFVLYRRQSVDCTEANMVPNPFKNCDAVDRENGTITAVSDTEIKVAGGVFSPSLDIEIYGKNQLNVRGIRLYRNNLAPRN